MAQGAATGILCLLVITSSFHEDSADGCWLDAEHVCIHPPGTAKAKVCICWNRLDALRAQRLRGNPKEEQALLDSARALAAAAKVNGEKSALHCQYQSCPLPFSRRAGLTEDVTR